MMHYRFSGVIYTIRITLKRTSNSCASSHDFSTYDELTDSYSWKSFDDVMYLVMPQEARKNFIVMTMYLQCALGTSGKEIPRTSRKILKEEFFPHICGVHIHSMEEPRLFLRPHDFETQETDDEKFRSEKILELITHN